MDIQESSISSNGSVELLDKDGELSSKLVQCLMHIFSKYCTPAPPVSHSSTDLTRVPDGAFLNDAGVDGWAQDTNGAQFSQDTKDDLREFFDVTDEGFLTFKGFLQLYALQTENDEEETWQDLSKHGFNRDLNISL